MDGQTNKSVCRFAGTHLKSVLQLNLGEDSEPSKAAASTAVMVTKLATISVATPAVILMEISTAMPAATPAAMPTAILKGKATGESNGNDSGVSLFGADRRRAASSRLVASMTATAFG